MSTAFISHTSDDDAFVARVAERLESAKITVWVDGGRIVPGDDIIQKIEQGLSDASHVVVVFSPLSLLSDWVREESHAAQFTAIEGGSRIIPILYGAISPSALPALLRSRLYVDFRDPMQFERAIAQLLSAFASSPESHTPAPQIRVVDFQIARRLKDEATALELLLSNPGKRTFSVKRLSMASTIPYPVSYAFMPETVLFPLSLTIGPRTANGNAVVGGAIGHEADEWRRPVSGELIFAPYSTDFTVALPLYIAIGPNEEVLLRIPIESVVGGTDPRQFSRDRARQNPKRGSFGTHITIEASDGKISSFTSPESLLAAIIPLTADIANDELQNRFHRRWR